jgi:hypothetical protein
MLRFERYDICEACWVFAAEWHAGGQCMHPHSGKEIFSRLSRLQFRPLPGLSRRLLTPNGRRILARLEKMERKGSKTPTPTWVKHLLAYHAANQS